MVFAYSKSRRSRRHGPQGYLRYQSYKQWLRDEFEFRCVYCLSRERWHQDGEAWFTVDHLQPKSVKPELECSYENLVYCCAQCNSYKSDDSLPDPLGTPYGIHLTIGADGVVVAHTRLGVKLVRMFRLDDGSRLEFRSRLLAMLRKLSPADPLYERWLGFPENLPELSAVRPPGGNLRPEGVRESHFEKRKRGRLSATY